ncbi:MAG TPA: TMEM175 family protein [Bryobacteraceae bacterium]|nr:TMEM175 family protein [Bryobacteraceae bacterium]
MPQETPAERETARLEAFSDGVFAIAITLLVLEIKVPHFDGPASSSALAAALLRQWPSYLALVTSFFTVLIMWVHHHIVFRLVHRADVNLLFVNGLLLLFVSVVPFPTALLAEYLGTPAAPAACTAYAGFFVGISICFQLLVALAFRVAVLAPDASPTTVRRVRRSYWAGPPLYLLATVIAPFFPLAAIGICTALWIFWAAMTREC